MFSREIVRQAALHQYQKDRKTALAIIGMVGLAKTHLELAEIWVTYKLEPQINLQHYTENPHALPKSS